MSVVGRSLAQTSATGRLSWAKLQEAHMSALKSLLDVLTTLAVGRIENEWGNCNFYYSIGFGVEAVEKGIGGYGF